MIESENYRFNKVDNPGGKKGEKRTPPAHIKIRQKQVMKKWLEGGMKDLRTPMLEAGYSPATANRPTAVTATETWKELMNEFFPDDFLAMKHKELLDQRNIVAYSEREWDPVGSQYVEKKKFKDIGLDVPAVAKALDMAYKLKGAYASGQSPDAPPRTSIYNLIYQPEFLEATRDYEDKILTQIQNDIARKGGRKSAPVWDVPELPATEGDGGVEGDVSGTDDAVGDEKKE